MTTSCKNSLSCLVRLFVPAALSILAACAKEQEAGAPQGKEIVFSSSVASYEADVPDTKSFETREFEGGPRKLYLHSVKSDWPVTDEDLERHGLTKASVMTDLYPQVRMYGYSYQGTWDGTATPNFMNGEQLDKYGDFWMKTGTSYLWPGADRKVRFFALSYADGSQDLKPSIYMGNSQFSNSYYQYGSQSSNNYSDILESFSNEYKGDGSDNDGKVSLTFRHSLSALRFKIAPLGADLTVKNIKIYGIYCTAKRLFGSNEWYDFQSYTSSRYRSFELNLPLSHNMSEPVDYTTDNDVMFVIPQTCPAGAKITMTCTNNGKTYTFSCDISGEVWEAGKEITYTISLDSGGWDEPQLDLFDVKTEFNYSNNSFYYIAKVNSYRMHASGMVISLPWTTEFSLDGGSTFTSEVPSFLSLMVNDGMGGVNKSNCYFSLNSQSSTQRIDPQTHFGASIGSSSDYRDLSLIDPITRTAVPRETANCYIVDSPGYYKVPLFYGNAIKGGVVNSAAYPLKELNANFGYFHNAYGEEIGRAGGSGNIASDLAAGSHTLNTTGGRLVWCTGTSALVEVVPELEDGGDGVYYLRFQVPEGNIREGSAVIGVLKDGSTDEFVWAWHIWVVSKEMELKKEKFQNFSGQEIQFLNHYLGETQPSFNGYAGCSFKLKIKNDFKERILDIVVNPYVSSWNIVDMCYYYWGNQNPVPPLSVTNSTTNIYYPSDASWQFNFSSSELSKVQTISKPYVCRLNRYKSSGGITGCNIWNAAASLKNAVDLPVVKTIYDPCPAGFSLPRLYAFTGFYENGSSGNSSFQSVSNSFYKTVFTSDNEISKWARNGENNNTYRRHGILLSVGYFNDSYFQGSISNCVSDASTNACITGEHYGYAIRPAACD